MLLTYELVRCSRDEDNQHLLIYNLQPWQRNFHHFLCRFGAMSHRLHLWWRSITCGWPRSWWLVDRTWLTGGSCRCCWPRFWISHLTGRLTTSQVVLSRSLTVSLVAEDSIYLFMYLFINIIFLINFYFTHKAC